MIRYKLKNFFQVKYCNLHAHSNLLFSKSKNSTFFSRILQFVITVYFLLHNILQKPISNYRYEDKSITEIAYNYKKF